MLVVKMTGRREKRSNVVIMRMVMVKMIMIVMVNTVEPTVLLRPGPAPVGSTGVGVSKSKQQGDMFDCGDLPIVGTSHKRGLYVFAVSPSIRHLGGAVRS